MPNITLHMATYLMRLHTDSLPQGMLLDFLENQALGLSASRHKVGDLAEWESFATSLRLRLRYSLGLNRLPERGPLHASHCGWIERSGYRVEKLLLDTLPGFTAPAHLYLPYGSSQPTPGILYVPGHWVENAKLEPDIQRFCANLALAGFAVLVYDPIGQGERMGDWRDHGHPEPLLVGVSQEGMMVWESLRAIDYLQSRPEVDPHRIGMVGASGGGLNTFYTSALDDRIQACVPICYVTTFFQMMTCERNRNWEDGVDLCNQVPQVMAYAEMSDILGLIAPRPLAIIAALQDRMAPADGARQVYAQARKIYALQHALAHIELIEINSEHGFSQAIRQAALGWLMQRLLGQGNGKPVPETEPKLFPAPYPPCLTYIDPPPPASLHQMRVWSGPDPLNPGLCYPSNPSPKDSILEAFPSSGRLPPPGPAITSLAQALARSATSSLVSHPHRPTWRQDLRQEIRKVLGPFPQPGPLHERLLKQNLYQGIFIERVVFESEPGILLPAVFLAPSDWRAPQPPVIYVDELGKEAGLLNGVVETLLDAGFAVLAVDVRGVGESAASDFEAATNALMMPRPLFGQRVWDVLRSLECLWNRVYIGLQVDKSRIACLGRGWAGLLVLYAAALDDRFAAAAAWETPFSYKDLLVEHPAFPVSVYMFDVLNHLDIPDLIDLIAPRPVLQIDPVDGLRNPIPGSLSSSQDGALDGAGAAHMEATAPAVTSTLQTIPVWLRKVLYD